MSKVAIARVFILTFLLSAFPVTAAEEILSFHSDIKVNADGTLVVTETIAVRAEGNQIRRGLYRDFPTRYRTHRGNRITVGFEPLEVLRDGKSEPWFTENLSNGVRINFGDDSFLPTPLDTTYTFRYRTNRQLGFFEHHDELYWNVTGTGWVFPIEQASAHIELPEPVPAGELRLDYYTGPQGARGQAATAKVVQPGIVAFSTTAPLEVREGLTVVVGFPKEIVRKPSLMQQWSWFLRDNRVTFIFLLGVAGVFLFYLYCWLRYGRNPVAGPVFPRYYPPEGFSPGALRYMFKGTYSDRCLAADLVQLATQGSLRIRREKESGGDKWVLEKQDRPQEDRYTPIKARVGLWNALFHSMPSVKFGDKYNSLLRHAKNENTSALTGILKPRYLVDNGKVATIGLVASWVIGLLSFLVLLHQPSIGAAIAFLVVAVPLVILNQLFRLLLLRPTAEGRQLLDHIEGLRLYMRVASKDDIAALNLSDKDEPPMDAERFQFLLPYALALDVEDAWTDKFTQAVGKAAAAVAVRDIHWYHSGVGDTSLSSLSRGLGSSLASHISSSSSPPGSSSGGGGGGSSGGGGGGGGGGGR